MRVGVCAGFGHPVGEARLAAYTAHGLTITRQDLQTCGGRTPQTQPVIDECEAWAAATGGRPLYICTLDTLNDAPVGAWTELRNEPEYLTPSEYVAELRAATEIARQRSLVLWACSISNLNQSSLAWLRAVLTATPVSRIAVHRYSPTAHQERLKSHKGFASRDAEVDALLAIIGARPYLVTEIGFHCARVQTGWWFWKRATQLTPQSQAAMLLDEIAFWRRRNAEGVVIFQEQDSPLAGIDKYGLRFAHDASGNPGPWKTDTVFGDAT